MLILVLASFCQVVNCDIGEFVDFLVDIGDLVGEFTNMAEHQYLSFGNSGVNSQGSSDCESSCLSRAILALGFQVLEHVGLRLFSDVRDSNTLNFGGLGEAEAVGDSLLNFFRDGNGLVVPTLLVVDESTVESLLDNAVL